MVLTDTLEREGVKIKPLLSLEKGLASNHPMIRGAATVAKERSSKYSEGYISHSDGSDWDDYSVD
jgi:hypothetical protein